jgi:hypothetical protein
MEDPDINPLSYSELIFNKRAQNTQWRKDSLFNKCCWESWIYTCRRLKLDTCLFLYQNQSKQIKDLNISPETLKQLQEVIGNTLEQIGQGNDFLSITQKVQYLRESMSKWDCIKLKSFCTTKEIVTRLKRLPTEWEKICQRSSDKGLISRIHRGLKKPNPHRVNILMKKWAHELKGNSQKKRYSDW